MNGSRRSILAGVLAALLAPRLARAGTHRGSVGQTCPPPFVREGDPLKALFTADLRQWANVNRHVRAAQVRVHPALTHLVPPTGTAYEWQTEFSISAGPSVMPAPWIIIAACALRND